MTPAVGLRSARIDPSIDNRAGSDPAPPRRMTVPPRWMSAIVFLVAAGARLSVIFRGAGLRGNFGYDAAVYFAAGDALTEGRMPYRDFVFLHPPGLMVALTPFSWLAHLTSDETGFGTACVAFALLGALNAVLVVRLCTHLGLGRAPAVAGGLLYALWFGSIDAEYLTKLEPFGNTVLLGALLAVARAERTQHRRWTVFAGVGLGLLVSIKIWWIVPAVVIAAWHLARVPSRRAALNLGAGFAAAVCVLDGPFFVAAPHAMFSSVVQDQLGRPRTATVWRRFADLTTASRLVPQLPMLVLGVVVVCASTLLVVVVRRAWRTPSCRPAVLLLVAQLVVVLAAPSWFPYYTDFLAVAAAVVVAGAAVPRPAGRPRRTDNAGWLSVVAAGLLSCAILSSSQNAVRPFPGGASLANAARRVRCVMSDAPLGLIELNTLSRGLAHDCPNWIDVTGRTYGVDAAVAGVSRGHNARWQRDLTQYLRSGQAVVIVHRAGTGMTAATKRAVTRDGVIARSDGEVLYRVVR